MYDDMTSIDSSLQKLTAYARGNREMVREFLRSWAKDARRDLKVLVTLRQHDPLVVNFLTSRLSSLLQVVGANSLSKRLQNWQSGEESEIPEISDSLNRVIVRVEEEVGKE